MGLAIDERKEYIEKLLKDRSSVTVAELSKTFEISEVSVRKLLDTMEQEGRIKRTWGGAISAFGSLRELSFHEKEPQNYEEKQAMAREAYKYIDDGDAIFLDNGTSTFELVHEIVNGPKRNIMVCTNTINIAMELVKADDIQMMFVGGDVRHNVMSCVGAMCISALDQLIFDKCFSSCTRFSLRNGFSTPSMLEAEVKRKAMQTSKKVIALADYSKFGDDSLVVIAPITTANIVVTDWRAPQDLVEQFADKGVDLIIAQENELAEIVNNK